MKNLIIFQNYFTPYRAKLFQEIGKKVDLTVIYLQKPEDEGRKWKESELGIPKNEKAYKDFTMTYKNLGFPKLRLGPVVWPTKLSELDQFVTKESKVIFLDNLPTNIAMQRIANYLAKTVSVENRIVWVEHQDVPETGSRLPFYSQTKKMFKTTSTFFLALKCNTVLAFSQMSVDYCKKLGLPLKGQKIVRTYQATYTEKEIADFHKMTERKERKPDQHIVVGFFGSFSTRKGIAELLTAIHYSPNLTAHFKFIGDGPEKKQIVEAMQSDSRIEIHGYVTGEEEKTKAFADIDVHIVPSEKDPWCLVVNEAASRGVPSIVSPNVGAKEMMVLVDKEFVMENNKPISIAKSIQDIEKLWKDEKKWQEIRTKTYEAAEKWSIEKSRDAFLKLME